MINKIQQNQIKDALLQLGLSEKEALVYLAILQSGETSIINITGETGLSRGTCFDIVERLIRDGFVAEIKRGKKRRIVVESPTGNFYKVLDGLHDKFTRTKKMVEEVLPLIKSIGSEQDFKPQIRVYSGESGFKKVWDEIFSSEVGEFLSIARVETFVKFAGEDFLISIQNRKIKAGMSSRAINENSDLANKLVAADNISNRETRLIPIGMEFPSTEIIYGDKIAMFSTRDENIVVVIESRDFASTHRAYFEMMWKFLEK
ncbi:MAG: helix-turn-helix domain-containing protein [Candidatus Buchananbacteria bacterium]